MMHDANPRNDPDPAENLSAGAAERSVAKGFLQRERGVSAAERAALIQAEKRTREEIERLERRIGVYERLVGSARALSSILDLDALLGAILREVVDLCQVDRGFLLLADSSGKLQVEKGYDAQAGHVEVGADTEVSRSLACQAFEEGKLRAVTNAHEREEFRTQESIQHLQLKTIVCVPLLTGSGPIGVLYLDSRRPESLHRLEDKTVLEAFSAHAAVALENARLHRELLDARAGLERENRDLRRALPGARGLGEILGQSRIMEDLRHRIGQLQEVDSPVLILGGSGTGKDLVARAIHAGSLRAAAPLQVIDCAAVPENLMESEMFGHKRGAFTGAHQDKRGLLEAADGGTLFLDEIGDMPLALQGKLLRAIEHQEFRRVGETGTRRVNVRILSATNRDLEKRIAQNAFREDLYYRLRVVTLRVPLLRERTEDLLPLAEHFLRINLTERDRPYTGFTPAAVRFLLSYPWPGNIRELKNAIEGACAFLPEGKPLDLEDLQLVTNRPPELPSTSQAVASETGLKEYREDAEKQLLLDALARNSWIVSRAARTLGISRQHLHNRIRYHGIERPRPRLPSPRVRDG